MGQDSIQLTRHWLRAYFSYGILLQGKEHSRHKQQLLRFCSVYNLMRDIDVEMEWVWGDTRYAFVCRMLRRSGFEYKSKETPYTVIAQEVVTSCTSGPYLAEDVAGSLLLLATAHLMFRDLCMCKENPLLIIILLTVWLTPLYPACVAKLVHPSENSITPRPPNLDYMIQLPHAPASWNPIVLIFYYISFNLLSSWHLIFKSFLDVWEETYQVNTVANTDSCHQNWQPEFTLQRPQE